MAPPQAGLSPVATETQATPSRKGRTPSASVFERLAKHGVSLTVRRRQRIGAPSDDQVYCVKSGMLVLCANASSERRQLLTLLYPGDTFTMAQAPPLEGIGLVAMTDSELLRIHRSSFDDDLEEARMLDAYVAERSANMNARAALHIARLASLPSEARVAAFILELALRTGRASNDQVSCDLPMSRCDIADYLSLNADTLSRIMTRLKERGAIATIGRSRTIIKSIKRLCHEVPICAATIALHQQSE